LDRFLKAELILNVLEHLETAKEVRDALNSLPPTYDGCYEFTLKQIERKDTDQRNLAFKVLSWLSHALGGLTVTALQEALSVQAGDEKVDEEKQIPVDDLISVCSGLVVTDTVNDTQNIRLLHETASRYLKNIRSAGFPPGHEIILKACLAYLSLPEFSDLCFFKIRADERARRHPFYEYAAKYWSGHVIQGNLESTFRDPIVNFLESNQRHSADEFLSSSRPSAWGCDRGTPWTDFTKHSIGRRDTPLHAAAAYGLRMTVRYLIKKKGCEKDRRNNFGETPLHRAVQVGRTGTMEELIARGADLDAKVHQHYLNEATPLILATICLQIEAVRILFNHGVDVNTFDPKYRTFPLHLAASMDTKLTRLLLDRGALVNFPGKSPGFPETWPMTSLHFAVFNAHAFQGALDRVSLLLDRGANINAQSSLGNTALHMALLAGHQDLARFLLQEGANVSLQNKNGKSVVQLARERGYLHWIEEGVPKEIFRKLQTGPPLHRAIWSKNYSLVCELLETGHDIAEEDQERVTPWEYCIRSADVELAQILVGHMNRHKSFDHVGNAAFEIALNHMTAFDYTDQKSWEKTVQICSWLLPFRRMFDGNLEFAKAESPICNYKKTFLIWAAELGRISQVEFFLRCGSDVNAADAFGNTGMHYAVGNKNMDMVRLLNENGFNLKLENIQGITPLIAAQKTENTPIRDYLKAALSRHPYSAGNPDEAVKSSL
jgi:ankyrin repeat protein